MNRSTLKFYRRAITIFVIALFVDYSARIYFNFQMDKIMVAEAILFPLSGFILLWIKKKDEKENIGAARFDVWFALFFLLGGLRSALWLTGLPIYTVNLIVLIVGLIIFIIFFLKSNKRKKIH